MFTKSQLRIIIEHRVMLAKWRRVAELEAILPLITFTDSAAVDEMYFELFNLKAELI